MHTFNSIYRRHKKNFKTRFYISPKETKTICSSIITKSKHSRTKPNIMRPTRALETRFSKRK